MENPENQSQERKRVAVVFIGNPDVRRESGLPSSSLATSTYWDEANSDDGNPLHLRMALRFANSDDGNLLHLRTALRFANSDDGNPLHLQMALRFANFLRWQPTSSSNMTVANEDDGNPLHLWTALRFANSDDSNPLHLRTSRLLMKMTATRFISGCRGC